MHIASLSTSALYAKIKLSYAGHLTEKEYTDLAGCKDLAEFAAYLKNKTSYGEAFAGVGGAAKLSRQHIEAIIRRMTLLRLAKMVRYARLCENYVENYYKNMHECECIVRRLRAPRLYTLDSYFLYLPEGFFTDTSFDLTALERAKTVEQIAEVLKGTVYETLLSDVFAAKEFSAASHLVPENILYAHVFTTSAEGFMKTLPKEEYAEVEALLALFSDMLTVDTMYRILSFYKEQREKLALYVYRPTFTHFGVGEREALLRAESLEDFREVLSKGRYKGLVPLMKKDDPHRFVANYVNDESKKHFSMTGSAAALALCYRKRISFEADNLITIAEGIEARVAPEKMLALLIQ